MKKILLAAPFLIACLGLVKSQVASRCVETNADVACTEQGTIRGAVEGEMLAFKGIPYAKPPVGSLRWRPTEPPEHWQGIRDGSRYGSICPQIVNQKVQGQEDCIFINVGDRVRNLPNRSPLWSG